MIDTLFPKSRFLLKNHHFTQYSRAFRDFSKIAIFDHLEKIFFCRSILAMAASEKIFGAKMPPLTALASRSDFGSGAQMHLFGDGNE